MSDKEATTMTVRAMGALLGLKKTESYYLVNKKVFDTVMVAGQKRVVKASFEEWYARQDWYRKVDGEPPGAKLHSNMYSVADLQKFLRNRGLDIITDLVHADVSGSVAKSLLVTHHTVHGSKLNCRSVLAKQVAGIRLTYEPVQ